MADSSYFRFLTLYSHFCHHSEAGAPQDSAETGHDDILEALGVLNL